MTKKKVSRIQRLVGAGLLAFSVGTLMSLAVALPSDGEAGGEALDVGAAPHPSVLVDEAVKNSDDQVRLVTYRDSAGGTCLDAVVVSSLGVEVGSTGGCGLSTGATNIIQAASGQRAEDYSSSDVLEVIVAGWVALDDGRLQGVAAGVASCDCPILVTWSDGYVESVPSSDGLFMETRTILQGAVGSPDSIPAIPGVLKVLPSGDR